MVRINYGKPSTDPSGGYDFETQLWVLADKMRDDADIQGMFVKLLWGELGMSKLPD